MPTASKLVSALLFGALGLGLAFLLATELPLHFNWSLLPVAVAAIGALMGWRWVGRTAEKGLKRALAASIGAAVLVLFWSVFLSAGQTMLQRSLYRRYHGFVDGLEDMLVLFVEKGTAALRPDVMVVVIAAGILLGLVAWIVHRIAR